MSLFLSSSTEPISVLLPAEKSKKISCRTSSTDHSGPDKSKVLESNKTNLGRKDYPESAKSDNTENFRDSKNPRKTFDSKKNFNKSSFDKENYGKQYNRDSSRQNKDSISNPNKRKYPISEKDNSFTEVNNKFSSNNSRQQNNISKRPYEKPSVSDLALDDIANKIKEKMNSALGLVPDTAADKYKNFITAKKVEKKPIDSNQWKRTVFIGNLPPNFTRRQLIKLLQPYGSLDHAILKNHALQAKFCNEKNRNWGVSTKAIRSDAPRVTAQAIFSKSNIKPVKEEKKVVLTTEQFDYVRLSIFYATIRKVLDSATSTLTSWLNMIKDNRAVDRLDLYAILEPFTELTNNPALITEVMIKGYSNSIIENLIESLKYKSPLLEWCKIAPEIFPKTAQIANFPVMIEQFESDISIVFKPKSFLQSFIETLCEACDSRSQHSNYLTIGKQCLKNLNEAYSLESIAAYKADTPSKSLADSIAEVTEKLNNSEENDFLVESDNVSSSDSEESYESNASEDDVSVGEEKKETEIKLKDEQEGILDWLMNTEILNSKEETSSEEESDDEKEEEEKPREKSKDKLKEEKTTEKVKNKKEIDVNTIESEKKNEVSYEGLSINKIRKLKLQEQLENPKILTDRQIKDKVDKRVIETIENLNGHKIEGHRVIVDFCRPKNQPVLYSAKQTVFLGGLSLKITEDTLIDAMKKFGNIKSVRIVRDKLTQMGLGYAFVQFETREEATECLSHCRKNILKIAGSKNVRIQRMIKPRESTKNWLKRKQEIYQKEKNKKKSYRKHLKGLRTADASMLPISRSNIKKRKA